LFENDSRLYVWDYKNKELSDYEDFDIPINQILADPADFCQILLVNNIYASIWKYNSLKNKVKEVHRIFEDEESNIIDASFIKIGDNHTIVLAYQNHKIIFFDREYNKIINIDTLDTFENALIPFDSTKHINPKTNINYKFENTIRYMVVRNKNIFVFLTGEVDFFLKFEIQTNFSLVLTKIEKLEEKLKSHYGVCMSENMSSFILISGEPETGKKQLIKEIARIKKEDLLLNFNVTEVKKKFIKAEVIHGGLLSSNKGINVPHTNLKKGGLTPKDIKDLKCGLKVGMDYVGLSFVQTADDVLRLRKMIGKNKNIKIVSKIERGIALRNIDKIIRVSDMIMIARGDLGIETPIEELPIVQKNLIRHAHWLKTPAIIATQVMTSMIKNPSPTRAEVSDIANAVLDGADVIMLSDETTVGDHALAAVKMLDKVITRTEKYINREGLVY